MAALDSKVALVTGAARRLGRAIALGLAQAGARLVLHYHTSEAEARALRTEIEASGGSAALVQADLGSAAGARAMVREAERCFGRLDVLVNNASRFHRTPLAATRDEDLDDFLAVNLRAPFVASLEFARLGPESGVIVNLTDASVSTPWPDYVAYQTSKAGLEALTRYLARALAPKIRVNAVAPGPILMPPGATEADRERALARVPMGRLGDAADVAAAVLYLATSGYLTGVVLPVDGGRRIG